MRTPYYSSTGTVSQYKSSLTGFSFNNGYRTGILSVLLFLEIRQKIKNESKISVVAE